MPERLFDPVGVDVAVAVEQVWQEGGGGEVFGVVGGAAGYRPVRDDHRLRSACEGHVEVPRFDDRLRLDLASHPEQPTVLTVAAENAVGDDQVAADHDVGEAVEEQVARVDPRTTGTRFVFW